VSRLRFPLLAMLGLLVLMGAAPVISSSIATALRTSSGTVLTMGAPSDGETLCRAGTTISGCTAGGAATVTVSSSTATLGASDTLVEVTASAANITLASASGASTSQQVTIHCARSRACLIQLTRAGSDTIDAATSRAGLVRPGASVLVFRTSSSAWTSTLNIDPRPAMSYFEWRPDAASGNLSNVASGWTQAGTAGSSVLGGRLYGTESRSGVTTATGWTLGPKFFHSDSRMAFTVEWYCDAPLSAGHRTMGGEVDGLYSGARSGWSGKGMVVQYESGDTNWQVIVRDSANSVHDTGAPVAAGHWRWLVYRDGSTVRWISYYSATDATFAGVSPVVGSATPSAWPSATTLQAQYYSAAASAWAGTLGVAGTAIGEML